MAPILAVSSGLSCAPQTHRHHPIIYQLHLLRNDTRQPVEPFAHVHALRIKKIRRGTLSSIYSKAFRYEKEITWEKRSTTSEGKHTSTAVESDTAVRTGTKPVT